MAERERTRSKGKKKACGRVLRFPQAKGKTITQVALFVSPENFTIDISFQDKTSLSFDVESCLQVVPELADWKTGTYQPLKRWRPVNSSLGRPNY